MPCNLDFRPKNMARTSPYTNVVRINPLPSTPPPPPPFSLGQNISIVIKTTSTLVMSLNHWQLCPYLSNVAYPRWCKNHPNTGIKASSTYGLLPVQCEHPGWTPPHFYSLCQICSIFIIWACLSSSTYGCQRIFETHILKWRNRPF